MMRFLSLVGPSLYGEAVEQVDQLEDGLTELGHEVSRIDLRAVDAGRVIAEQAHTPCAAAISWDGAGVELGTPEHRSLFDALGVPVVMWLRRHPAYYLAQFTLPIKGMRVVCADGSHQAFMKRYFDYMPACTLAPGATLGSGAIWDGEELGPVMAATYYDPELVRTAWTRLPATIHPFIEALSEAALAAPTTPLHQLAEGQVRTGKLTPDHVAVLPYVDAYMRGWQRRLWLDALTEAGIAVDLYGRAWDTYAHISAHRWHGPIAHPFLLAALYHTPLLLVAGTGLTDTPHPITLAALAAGTPVLCEPTSFTDPNLTIADPTTIAAQVRQLLNRPKSRAPLIAQSWKERSQQLLDWLGLAVKV